METRSFLPPMVAAIPPSLAIREMDQAGRTAIFIEADWIVVEGFKVNNVYEAGVYIAEGADHNIVRDLEITGVGEGIKVHGQYNLITQNSIHDLHMINNTPGGVDDYGAVGVVL